MKKFTSPGNASGIAGLLCPGLGHFLQKQRVAGVLVFLAVSTPLIWSSLLFNQLLNTQVLVPGGEPASTILDLEFITRFSEIEHVPPSYYVLLVLTLILHLWAAAAARRGPPTPEFPEDDVLDGQAVATSVEPPPLPPPLPPLPTGPSPEEGA